MRHFVKKAVISMASGLYSKYKSNIWCSMKFQLLMIIAVIASSILTISQRANAKEVNQFRWMEPIAEQHCGEVVALDEENGSDKGCLARHSSHSFAEATFSRSFYRSSYFLTSAIHSNVNPRAPPFSLI